MFRGLLRETLGQERGPPTCWMPTYLQRVKPHTSSARPANEPYTTWAASQGLNWGPETHFKGQPACEETHSGSTPCSNLTRKSSFCLTGDIPKLCSEMLWSSTGLNSEHRDHHLSPGVSCTVTKGHQRRVGGKWHALFNWHLQPFRT